MNRRKLLLTALDWTRPKDPPLSLGHASILTNLLHSEVQVKEQSWAVNAESFNTDQVINFVMDNADDNTDLALGAFVWNEAIVQGVIKELKRLQFPGKIILGGPQISYMKTPVSPLYPDVDIFLRGYAEEALTQLYTSPLPSPEIQGVTYKGQSDFGKSAGIEFESLQSPYLSGILRPQSFIRWETQRGCPFRCSFCQHRQPDISRQRRDFPLSRSLKEAQWIVDNPIIQDIAVLDPVFNSGPNYLSLMDKLIEGRYSGKIALQCRMELVSKEFLDQVEQLNTTGRVVLEFGLQTIHEEEMKVINRKNSLKKVREVLQETRRRNIETELSLIFGLPSQTLTSFKESVEFCKDQGVSRIYAFPLMLLRGTPLFEQKEKLGLKESSDFHFESIPRIQTDIPHVVESLSFTYDEWLEMAEIAGSLEEYNTACPK